MNFNILDVKINKEMLVETRKIRRVIINSQETLCNDGTSVRPKKCVPPLSFRFSSVIHHKSVYSENGMFAFLLLVSFDADSLTSRAYNTDTEYEYE